MNDNIYHRQNVLRKRSELTTEEVKAIKHDPWFHVSTFHHLLAEEYRITLMTIRKMAAEGGDA